MELFNNIAEYYDELYPVSDEQKNFFSAEIKSFPKPVKYLSIGSGSGSFEHFLAKEGLDVTGLETVQSLVDSANRKRRTQIMSLRFFQMSSLEMCRFLGKNFYNVISIFNGRMIFTHDETLMAKLFYDCHQLLTENGKMILQLPNFLKYTQEKITLPCRESIRVKLFTKISKDSNGKYYFNQTLETGNGKKLSVTEDMPIMPIKKSQIESYAKEAGFKECKFYSDFSPAEFTPDSDQIIAVIS